MAEQFFRQTTSAINSDNVLTAKVGYPPVELERKLFAFLVGSNREQDQPDQNCALIRAIAAVQNKSSMYDRRLVLKSMLDMLVQGIEARLERVPDFAQDREVNFKQLDAELTTLILKFVLPHVKVPALKKEPALEKEPQAQVASEDAANPAPVALAHAPQAQAARGAGARAQAQVAPEAVADAALPALAILSPVPAILASSLGAGKYAKTTHDNQWACDGCGAFGHFVTQVVDGVIAEAQAAPAAIQAPADAAPMFAPAVVAHVPAKADEVNAVASSSSASPGTDKGAKTAHLLCDGCKGPGHWATKLVDGVIVKSCPKWKTLKPEDQERIMKKADKFRLRVAKRAEKASDQPASKTAEPKAAEEPAIKEEPGEPPATGKRGAVEAILASSPGAGKYAKTTHDKPCRARGAAAPSRRWGNI